MSDYQFNLSNFTIADAMRVKTYASMGDVYSVLIIANQFIPINIMALPLSETSIVLNCFLNAVLQEQSPTPSDPIDQLIRKALEEI